MANQTKNVAELLNPPLGKKPNLSEKEMKNMRMVLQSISIQTPVKATYYYNIVEKQSNWGFSSHQRMLILNVQQKGLSYLSSIPQGYLPYTYYEQLAANKVKQKVFMTQTKQFRCYIIKGKISTFTIEWVDKDKNEKKWILTMGSSKLMNDWVDLINSVKDNTFDKRKYDAMNKMGADTLFMGGDVFPMQPIVTNNNAHSFMNNPMYGTRKSTQVQQAPMFGGGKDEEFSLKNQQKENVQANSNPFKSQAYNSPIVNTTNKQQTPNNANPLQLQTPSAHNASVSNISNKNQPNNPNYNPIQNLGYQSAAISPQNNNKYQSPVSELANNKSRLSQPGNAYDIPSSNNYNTNGNNNFGSNYTQQPNRNNTVYNNPQTNNFKTQVMESKSKQNVVNNNLQLQSDSSRISPIQYNHTYKPYDEIYGYNTPSVNENTRTLQSSQSQPPNDFVEELKRKRQKHPQKFVLNNQLSKKKFDQLSYQPQLEQQYPQYYDSNNNHQVNNFGTTPAKSTIIQRVSSQAYFDRDNSQNKFPQIHSQATTPKNHQHLAKAFSRSKITSNHQSSSIKDTTNPQLLSKHPSRSQLSSQKLQGVPSSSGGQNNYDRNEMLQQEQDKYNEVYKPNSSFTQSTKNLTKIRSDYLRRKINDSNSGGLDNRFDDNKIYPATSNNKARMLINEQIEQQDHQNYYHQPEKNESSFDRTLSQRRREQSLHNLNKVNSAYLSIKNYKSYPSYNQLWLQTSNPNKKIQVYDQFVNRSRQLIKTIVQEISFPTSNRQYQPIDSNVKQNFYVYAVENIIIKLHFFNHHASINGIEDQINIDVPVLYNHSTFEQIKRQFYNYNLILGVTGNQGKIKVPLCCYIEYRGVLALVKADIPQSYKQVDPYSYQDQFDSLENMTKVRFIPNTFNCYQSLGYRGGQGRFIMLWNLISLIPAIPNGLKNDSSYFRKQFLLQYDEILDDLESSGEAHAFTVRHIVGELLAKLEALEIQVLHSKDLTREFHRVGLSLGYLSQIYNQTQSQYLKKLFLSELVTLILTQIVRSELNHAFSILPAQNMHHATSKELDSVIVSCAHILINQFFSYTQRSESMWKLIAKEMTKRYRINELSKQDVIPGYILSGVVHKLNLECDFKQKSFMKNKKFFIHQNILPRTIFITFTPRIRRFDMQYICPTYSKCKQLIQSEQLNTQHYDQLSTILNLKNRQSEFPNYYEPLLQELKTYLANFIPYTIESQYQKLDIYEFMYQQPITYNGIKTSFLAIKWLIKANQIEKANQIFQIKFHELSYWLNQYNTAITEFYDFFSMFYASLGDFQESVCLAKSSLINITKILGQGALPVADKHYQLGNIYFKINKKNEALKEYNKTKHILVNHSKTTIPEYGIILLKISLLSLNFGQLTQCLTNALSASRIFQNNGGNENQQVECFEILARVYQITRKQGEMASLCEACGKTLNSTESPKVMERILKIIAYPKICELSSQEQQALLPILLKLYQHKPPTSPSLYNDSFNYLHKLSLRNISIKKKLYNFLQNMTILAEEVNRKDLIRRHVSFNERTSGDAEQMLVMIEAIGNIIGWNFLIGMVKEGWYD